MHEAVGLEGSRLLDMNCDSSIVSVFVCVCVTWLVAENPDVLIDVLLTSNTPEKTL